MLQEFSKHPWLFVVGALVFGASFVLPVGEKEKWMIWAIAGAFWFAGILVNEDFEP